MEEMMMMMITSPENPIQSTNLEQSITTTTCPSWKLYENPFYYSQNHEQHQQHHQHHQHHRHRQSNTKHLHRLHLPVPTRKIAASFWDLTFFRPIMESELDLARAQIMELKSELDYERKLRRKAESVSKRLAKEMADERRGREAMERVCEKLAREISSQKTEIGRMKREIEEERKMLRMAEVLREERVQMKLGEAKLLYEEKLLELEGSKRITNQISQENSDSISDITGKSDRIDNDGVDSTGTSLILAEKSVCNSTTVQRKASPEPENHHIKRGIKGFVEFPRVVRAIGSKSRQWGTKLECQKAQLRILLKQKSPMRSSNLIMSLT